MTFGAAATAYAQAPAATSQLTSQITIGSPTAAASSPTLNQSDPAAGATNNQLSSEVTAPTTVSGTSANTTNGTPADYAAVEITLSGPYTFSSTSSAEVIDTSDGVVLGSLSDSSTDQSLGTTTTTTGVVYASSDTAKVSAGDTLEVIINNVTNSSTASSGDVTLTLGTATSGSSAAFKAASSSATVSTASASTNAAQSPTLTLSPNNNPAQLTTLTYTFQVENAMEKNDTFAVDLTATPVDGSATVSPTTSGLTLNVNGASETSNVSSTYSNNELTVTVVGSTGLGSGVYTLSVPITSSATNPGIEQVSAEYKGSTATGSGGPAFVSSSSTAAWGYPEDLTSVKASDPYAGASSTVTIDFTDLDGGTTPLMVSGLGLSSDANTLATLEDTKTGTNLGALIFNNSDTSTISTAVSLTSGDSYSLTYSRLPLPSSSTTVGLGTDFAPSSTMSLSLGSSASTKMQVSASTTSAGVSSNWTLSGIEAATTLASGSTLTFNQTITGSAGNGSYSFLPTSASAYQIVDLSNSADTQSPSSVSVTDGKVVMTLASSIPSGDVIDVTVSGITNDPTASTSTVTLSATGDYLEAAQLTAPSAASTMAMANGAIANDSGALYVWAGGYAFHLPTIPDAAKIEGFEGDPTQQMVSIPSTAMFASGDTLAEGTLVQGVSGGTVEAPIYVVGTSGDLYHIASPAAFVSDGYSAKDVVQIPQSDLSMMTMASTTAPMAYSVEANGSFWQAAGTSAIYEWVGGVAVQVANPSDLEAIAKYMGETLMATWPQVTSGTVPTSAMAPSVPAMGTVVKVLDGSSAGSMYVSTGSYLVPLSAAQMTSLGYPMNDVLEVSSLSGIMVMGS
jgi:hypothetical protein